jgi:hypothetical protein
MKIEINRQGNFILACLFIHFLFFGFLCNIYDKAIGENVLYLYKVMFQPVSFLSTIILFIIVFIMVYREKFSEFGIKNSIWLVLVIVIESWIWYFFINPTTLNPIYPQEYTLDIFISTFLDIFPGYFIRYESYLTILILLGINLGTAFLAGFVKVRIREYRKKLLAKPTVI